MASISGAQTNMGVKIATTWGTAVACGTANRFVAEVTPNFNVNELTSRTIGSGAYMLSSATRGNFIPTVSVVGDMGYRNNCDVIIAQLWGTSGTPSEVTASQGDYKHTITMNTTLNAKYLTLAYEDASATTMEFSTCACRSIGLKTTSVPGYLEFSAELLANTATLSSSTNTNATLANCTFTEGTAELTACDFSDLYRQNTSSGGSLSGSDQYNITGFDFSFNRPQDIVPEIKGASGNAAPVSSGYWDGTFNVTVKELADHAMYTLWSAETAYKAYVDVQGTQIASGTNKTVRLYLPKMLLVTEPQYNLTSAGTNTLSLSWRLLKASSNPTGMSSTYPYWEITNTLSTSLLA